MENRTRRGNNNGSAARPARGQAPKRRSQAAKGSRSGGWLKAQLAQRPLPIWAVVVADVLVFAVALNVFALFHHVLPRAEKSVGIVSQRVSTAQEVAQTPEPEAVPAIETQAEADSVEPEPAPTEVPPDPVGVFANRFADKFTDGEVISDVSGYRSANLNLTYTKHEETGLVYRVVDIYIRKIEDLQCAFAKDTFGRGRWERLTSIAQRKNAVVAINGDYYGGRADGIVIRNGELYRDEKRMKRDVCVINWDGTMEVFTPETWNTTRAMENGAYQAWNFGPSLLDAEGHAKESFDSEVSRSNPRTAIGYYEPGHYCFVVVDGRSKLSGGLTLPDLSKLMEELGCRIAYNLDGGQSSEMVVNGQTVSRPYKGGRSTCDAILLMDE